MISVGLYGVENSHAKAFCTEFRDNPAYADFKVAYVGGIYPESVEELAKTFGAEIENDPEKMAEKVDCAMITCRDGKYHLGAALPFLRRGLPIFLDKPLTVREEDCETLLREAAKYGGRFIGGSSVKISPDVEELIRDMAGKKPLAGNITCPVSMDNPYGGFSFYAAHLSETLLRIFGYNPKTVEAHCMPHGVYGTVHYENFPVHFTYLDGISSYAVEADMPNGILQKSLDISDIHRKETEVFCRFIKEGKSDFTAAELAKSVYLLSAIERSFTSGKTEVIGSLPQELL